MKIEIPVPEIRARLVPTIPRCSWIKIRVADVNTDDPEALVEARLRWWHPAAWIWFARNLRVRMS